MEKKKIIDLTIIDQLEETGVGMISLVEDPAINIGFMAFSEEFIKPNPGEPENEFIGRCMTALESEFPDQDQRLAVCYSYYEMDISVNAPPYIEQDEKRKKQFEEMLLAYFSSTGITQEEFSTRFANATQIPWEEGDIFPEPGRAGRTFYKYEGEITANSRDFCVQMIALDRLYTFEEIQTAGQIPVNPGFGPNGASNYNIWKYKGGPNCKHRWQKYYAQPTGELQNKGKANGLAGERPINMPKRGYMNRLVFSMEGDQKILVGPAMIPGLEIPRYNQATQEIYYVVFSEEVVAKIAEKFMRQQSTWATNIDHSEKMAKTYIFENWIIEDPLTDKAKTVYNFSDLPRGTWMVKMRVSDDEVWENVKAGRLRGFSVEGEFITQEQLDLWEKNIQQNVND